MPIVISREGPVEPREMNPLTPEQKTALWESIVLSWCRKNPERLAELAMDRSEVPA